MITRKLTLSRVAVALLGLAGFCLPVVANAAPGDEIAKAVANGEVVDLGVPVATEQKAPHLNGVTTLFHAKFEISGS